MEINWQWYQFEQLDKDQLYNLLRLRMTVFMLEQQSLYLDLDGVDSRCEHLLGTAESEHLVAYLRLIPPSQTDPAVHLGRIVVDKQHRGVGLGKTLIERGLQRSREGWPGTPVAISAQQTLVAMYQGFGFKVCSAPYDDGGVMHVDMQLD